MNQRNLIELKFQHKLNLPIENTNKKIIKKNKNFQTKNLNKTDTIQTHLFSYDFSTTKQILNESKEI